MLGTGIKGAIEKKVTSEMTARFVGSGELEVLATPVLISLVEEAAWRSVAGQLEEGQGTVGTLMNLKHTAATPIGLTVRCETELIEIDRRRLVFSIKAYDEKEQIADGVCERFIIDNE
ncbi:MAG: thioesterase family protein, partial [Lachnospiraceae bacterium]|nr:thioesterase family protein [Lachnospiraceae bacterium]